MRARLFVLWVAAVVGCNNPVFLSERRPLETAAAGGADVDLYVLPVRVPSALERQQLMAEQMRLGLMRPIPWARLSDFEIEIEWVVKNLDAQPVTAFFVVNGGNEFGDYVPSAYLNPNLPANQQTPPPPLFGNAPLDLAASEVRTGVLREDDLHEAGIDLEAITRYPDPAGVTATPFMVIEHNSAVSTLGLAGVPAGDVTPAMVRYAFTLSSSGHVVLDYNVRVRDHAGKLASPTDRRLYVSPLPLLAPPVSPVPPVMGPGGAG